MPEQAKAKRDGVINPQNKATHSLKREGGGYKTKGNIIYF